MLVKPIEAPAVCSRDALLQDFEGELLQQGYAVTFIHKFPKYEKTNLGLRIGHPNLFHLSLAEFRWERFMLQQGQRLAEKSLAFAEDNPTLENSSNDVHYETDFRSVYAKVIDSWLGGDSVSVLGGDFRTGAPAIL